MIPRKTRAIRGAAALLAILASVPSCGKGCASCSPLGKIDDPLALMPADSVVLVQVDVGALGNDAIFRTLVMSLWEKESCLATVLLEDVESVTVTMRDAVPDRRTMPRAVVVTRGTDPARVIECLGEELFPGGGEPDEEEHRGVRILGYPERSALRLALVNDRMLAVGDMDGLRRMVDTALDGGPSLATENAFAGLAAGLPARAQVRAMAVPGPALREGARQRLDLPWSAVLDCTEIAVGVELSKAGLRVEGRSVTIRDPAQVARMLGTLIEAARENRFLRVLGIADLLADLRVRSSGNALSVAGTAPEKTVTRVIEGAGALVEIGL